MKIPRDLNAENLIKILKQLDYIQVRQTGSHIRLKRIFNNMEHNITIPNHNPIKIGTLNNIFKDIASNLNIPKSDLINRLF